jgi:hypothetical protein
MESGENPWFSLKDGDDGMHVTQFNLMRQSYTDNGHDILMNNEYKVN